jgi:cell fate (sporulation/competence/biofilm development) regulator YmcA (YheA/YmcA/DUF963 family)
VSRIKEVKEEFSKLPEVIRIRELEAFIDNNEEIKSLFNNLKSIQKQMVHAKEYNQPNQYNIYKDEYDSIYNNLLDKPFMEEYLELLEIVDDKLSNFTYAVEKELNKIINK